MANYFSHDSNARNSDKIIPLRMKMGAEGYGIYFMLLERLREEPDYTSIKDYNMLAFDLRVDTAKLKAVVESFGLFSFTDDGERFYSEGFLERMKQKDVKSEKARQSISKRWERLRLENKCDTDVLRTYKQENTNVLRTYENTDTIKEKKSKENNPPFPPLSGEFSAVGVATLAEDGDCGRSPLISSDSSTDSAGRAAGGGKGQGGRFQKPTLEEVGAYCAERRNSVDPSSFVDFYESKGWMIGRNKMKDWKAAVRTWEKSHPSAPTEQPQRKPIRL